MTLTITSTNPKNAGPASYPSTRLNAPHTIDRRGDVPAMVGAVEQAEAALGTVTRSSMPSAEMIPSIPAKPLTSVSALAQSESAARAPHFPRNGSNIAPEDFFTVAQALIDPDDLVGRFRRGELSSEELINEDGQITMLMLNDRITRMQAVVDAFRNIMEAYNRSLVKAVDAIGR